MLSSLKFYRILQGKLQSLHLNVKSDSETTLDMHVIEEFMARRYCHESYSSLSAWNIRIMLAVAFISRKFLMLTTSICMQCLGLSFCFVKDRRRPVPSSFLSHFHLETKWLWFLHHYVIDIEHGCQTVTQKNDYIGPGTSA